MSNSQACETIKKQVSQVEQLAQGHVSDKFPGVSLKTVTVRPRIYEPTSSSDTEIMFIYTLPEGHPKGETMDISLCVPDEAATDILEIAEESLDSVFELHDTIMWLQLSC